MQDMQWKTDVVIMQGWETNNPPNISHMCQQCHTCGAHKIRNHNKYTATRTQMK